MISFWSACTLSLFALLHLTLAGDPISIPWNTAQSFGPDGPWHAVRVTLGDSELSLYPGGDYKSFVFSKSFCDGEPDCPASTAGLYDESTSKTKENASDLASTVIGEWESDIQMNLTSDGQQLYDDITFAPSDTAARRITAKRILFWSLNSQTVRPPGGRQYPSRVGSLATGGPAATYTVKTNEGASGEAFTFSGYIARNYGVSNSMGLHMGSVRYNISGSLIMGGYDRKRAVGPVLTSKTVLDGIPVVSLIGVSIGMDNNGTANPLNVSDTQNFLSDEGPSIQTLPHPQIPYLQLPHSVCRSLASVLPITFSPQLGLYLWKIDDPQYAALLASSAALRFAFASSLTSNVTISVPFPLLNLTLEAPLADSPTPYFACMPINAIGHSWQLGRAFLQAAYLGINWDKNRSYLAQAPGPGFDQTADVVAFSPSDSGMASGPQASYAASWEKIWAEQPMPTNGSSSGTSALETGGSQNYLSRGAIAGIVVGAIVAVSLALLVAAYLLLRRRSRRRAAIAQRSESTSTRMAELPHMHEGHIDSKYHEADNDGEIPSKHQLDGQPVHETEMTALYEMSNEKTRSPNQRYLCEAPGTTGEASPQRAELGT